MPNNLTDQGENMLLNWQLTSTTVARPTVWLASLHVGATSEATPSTGELTIGSAGYTRANISTAGFTVTGNTATNAGALQFGPCATTDWGVVSNVGVWSSATATVSANGLWIGPLTTAKTVAVGDSLTIAIGALSLSLD